MNWGGWFNEPRVVATVSGAYPLMLDEGIDAMPGSFLKMSGFDPYPVLATRGSEFYGAWVVVGSGWVVVVVVVGGGVYSPRVTVTVSPWVAVDPGPGIWSTTRPS